LYDPISVSVREKKRIEAGGKWHLCKVIFDLMSLLTLFPRALMFCIVCFYWF
jgi:hypothetical protein